MTPERGFRRIVLALSLLLFGSGILLAVVLAAASVWSLHLDRDRLARMTADGCPGEAEPKPAAPTVVRIAPERWRVSIQEKGYVSIAIVSARRQLTEREALVIVAEKSDRAAFEARWHPSSDITVVDCMWANQELSKANQQALSSRLIEWWFGRPFVLAMALPLILLDAPGWMYVASMVVSPIVLAVAATAAAWAVFYLIRWIARGFSGG